MVSKDLKVALVHDYLPTYGGAEAVLSALHEVFPEAPIYTIFSNVNSNGNSVLDQKFKKAEIITSWFDYLPFRERLMSPLLFLIPLIWDCFDFSEYDLVISSASWAITKGFALRDAEGKLTTKEICYCHTPPRYLYGYDTSGPWKRYRLVRIYAAIAAHFMRIYDFKRAQKVTQFVANSREVAARIKKFYRRDSVVVNPPVDLPDRQIKQKMTDQTDTDKTDQYFLTGGRLEAAKNFDLIVKTCNELKIGLKVFGRGGEEEILRRMAGPTIEFLGPVSEDKKYELMANCKAFIVAAKDEDFGITPVEAMACGSLVVAYRGGGYTETVLENKTGIFFDELSINSLVGAIKKIDKLKISGTTCRKQAEKFSKDRFIKEIKSLVEKYARAS